ncbi:MAG TPA: carbohydrate binding domain-containing protein [Verrucomicrobiae bacterium]|nr:carbohydrate binding domain-containing protein [Verrucomicrobiae bacterium]
MRLWQSLAMLTLAAAFPGGGVAAGDGQPAFVGDMEGPFVGGLAAGWVKNCYGSNDVVFAEETRDFHGGRAAQRVTCTRFITGGVQIHSADVAVEKGKSFTVRLWMKGDVESPVYIGIRKHGEPYTGYLKRHALVKNEWRPYLLCGEASDGDPHCGIYLMFAGTGTLLLDDIVLLDGIREEIPVSEMPPEKGNRIYNSGFEAGPEGWTPTGGFAVEETGAHSGRCCARLGTVDLPSITLPVNRPIASTMRPRIASPGIECRPFSVRACQRYTLSAWMRAAQANTRVRLRFFEWADGGGDQPSNRNERGADVTVTTEWARYQVDGIALPNMWEAYVARIVPGGTIWLDDVQIEEGAATEYRPAGVIEVGAETATRWCRVGEDVEVAAHVAIAGGGGDLTLTYILEDLWARPLRTVCHSVRSAAIDRARFTADRAGMFRVQVRAADSPAVGEVWFGAFPKRDQEARPASPFGTHVTATVPRPTNTLLASEAMGARWVRLHDFGDFCHWRVVEPEKGNFVWRDAEIDELTKRGFKIMANLGHPPIWAGRPHPAEQDHGSWTSAPPRDIAEWEGYVSKTVEHFRDRIGHWEIWNEPYGRGFFSGTPEEYAELLRVAYRAIKRTDPCAVVIGGCFSTHASDWTRRVLAQGGLDSMDALSYHVYWSPPMTTSTGGDEPTTIEMGALHFIELMRERGAVKPLYMTEGGIRCPPFASWLPAQGFSRGAPFGSMGGEHRPLTGLEAACGLVRGMVQMLSAGVTNICYYYTGGELGAMPWFSTMANGYYVLMDYDGRPKPTMMAYSALERQLDGAVPAGRRWRDGMSVHLFSRGPDAGAIAVAWSDQERTLQTEGTVVLDLMGNERKERILRPGQPMFIVAPGLTPAQLDACIR